MPPFSLGGPEDYAFSPDSKEIAFAKKTDKVEAISTNSDIFTIDLTAAAAQPKQITDAPGADGGPQVLARRQVPDVAIPGAGGVRGRPLDAEPARSQDRRAPRRGRQLGSRD